MIDKRLQEELRVRFNPDGSQLRRYQMRLLDILKFIDQVCRENNIHYWLSSGTCLGAIRHEGFIPWDDDADVEMFEEDYKKFCLVMSKIQSSQFVLQNNKTDKNYHFSFGKVRDLNSIVKEDNIYDVNYKYHGCYVDVFPVAPSNSLKIFNLASFISLKYRRANVNNNKICRWCWSVLNTISLPILNMVSKIKINNTYRHILGQWCPKKRNYQHICAVKRVPFEGLQFPVPSDWNGYLSLIYGNYLNIPDVNKIQVHLTNFKLT